MEYICTHCNIGFTGRKRGDRVIKFCSTVCSGHNKRGGSTWNKGIPCSTLTRQKISKSLKGKRRSMNTEFKKGKHPHNYIGRVIRSNGYVYLHNPQHPMCDGRGYVAEHRLVAEQFIQRTLSLMEIVHHINEIKTDNRPENLYIFPNNVSHLSFHKNKTPIISNVAT